MAELYEKDCLDEDATDLSITDLMGGAENVLSFDIDSFSTSINFPEIEVTESIIYKGKPIEHWIKEGQMNGLTLGTWVVIVLVMIIVTKMAHLIGWRTIVRPLKKVFIFGKKEAKTIEREWKETPES